MLNCSFQHLFSDSWERLFLLILTTIIKRKKHGQRVKVTAIYSSGPAVLKK